MAEIEVLTKIANELSDIHFILALINIALWLILVCKRNYSYTDGIKDAIIASFFIAKINSFAIGNYFY